MPKKSWDIPKKKNNRGLKVLMVLLVGAVLLVAVYFLPPVRNRLEWRLIQLRVDIIRFFNPPVETSFSPGQQAEMAAIVNQTQTAIAPTPTPTLEPTQTPTNYVSATPTQEPSPTPTPTPLPESVRLEGVVHEFQKFNNCGPANLSMALSYWGWEGDQRNTADWLKPNWHDRNVMLYEMQNYVTSETEFDAVIRYGGNLKLIKTFLSAGFPVIIEKGFEEEVEQDKWMGHYGLATGYDDSNETFIFQDSYVQPNYPKKYDNVEWHWRSFNYAYMVIYPSARRNEVMSILGPHVDEVDNYRYAAQMALQETTFLEGRDLFFAWYNYGTSLVFLNDYYGAAQAYDKAFDLKNQLWPLNDEPNTTSYDPWRIVWYQTGPYFAYFYTGRYNDVIELADYIFDKSIEDAIEESWVWRGRAKAQLGDKEGAIEDFRTALEWHPGWAVAEQELRNLGVEP
jgi:tetratricopeptide (TPR) repeat protein